MNKEKILELSEIRSISEHDQESKILDIIEKDFITLGNLEMSEFFKNSEHDQKQSF